MRKLNIKLNFLLVIFLISASNVGAEIIWPEDNRFIFPEYSKRISMDFRGAPMSDVLKIFSKQSGMNFIATNDVSAKQVTLYLEDVPMEEALELILEANGLTYELQPGSDVFLVKAQPPQGGDLMTRIYYLKYATVFSSKFNKTIVIKADADEGDGKSSGGGGQQQSAGGIASIVKTVMSSSGNITEDPRTNSLIVTDMESRFPLIEETIARLDIAVPQVLIEVEMLDVAKGTADHLGLKWGQTPLKFNGGQRQHVFPWNTEHLVDDKGYEYEEAEFTTGIIDFSELKFTLDFLRTKSDTKSLARPRILTLNNETAQIKISTDEAIGVKTSNAGTGGLQTSTQEAERFQTGVFLTVTPQINLAAEEITMAIAPRVVEAKVGETFSDTTFKDPEERGSRSILKIKSGQTIIIGGLIRSEESIVNTKIPILGDIPLIGMAFRHKDKNVSERELLIFITPHILTEQGKTKLLSTSKQNIHREQDTSPHRLKQIERELGVMEDSKF